MISTTTISETLFDPAGNVPAHAHIRFELSAFDSSEDDTGTPLVVPTSVTADINASTGAITATLFRNLNGLRGTVYRVIFEQFTDATKQMRAARRVEMGTIQIPADAETSDLSSLLKTPATVPGVWYSTITEAEYDAAIAAAADAEAWAQSATAPDPDDATSKSAKTWAAVAQAAAADGSVSSLADVGDVTITAIANGEILRWNGTGWINNTLAEAGIAAASHTHTIANVTGLQAALDGKVENTTISTFGASLVDDADAAAARTTLGLGTIAVMDGDSIDIKGGTITGITDLAVADGGTGASTASAARTNLGAQVQDALLDDIAALTVSPGDILYVDASSDIVRLPKGTDDQVLTLASGFPSWADASGAGGVSDGDKGDIVVSSSGSVWSVDTGAITLSNMADLAASTIIGRADGAGTGVPTALTATQVRTILNVEDGATADQTGAEIKTAYEGEADTNALTDALLSKLNGIEANADVTDTVNVTAAGALMDSEVTNLAAVKAFNPTDYATAAQGSLATTAHGWGDHALAGYLTSVAWADVTGKPTFAAVATTGAYSDLTGLPSLFSGAYADLTGKPTLGTAAPLDVAAAGDAAAGQVVKGSDSRLTDARTPTSHTHTVAQITDFPSLSTVATSGAYSDLTGLPSLFDGAYSSLSGIPATFTPSAHTHAASDVTSGTFADARIAQTNVTQHQAALSITESQVSDLGSYEPADADILKADTADQLTAAFTAAVDDDGTQSSGTYTPSLAAGSQYKKVVNGGAFTLAPPSLASNEATTLSLFITNNASAGAITTSGFTQVTGDSFSTTNGDDFLCRIEVFDIAGTGYSLLNVVALQ